MVIFGDLAIDHASSLIQYNENISRIQQVDFERNRRFDVQRDINDEILESRQMFSL